MDDTLNSGSFVNHDWFETLNGEIVINYFIAGNTRSVPSTRILKMIVFFLLTAGLVGVITYNIHKMIYDPPKLSVTLEDNRNPPSMLICNMLYDNLEIVYAKYYRSFSDFAKQKMFFDLLSLQMFSNLTRKNGDCHFFNGTVFSRILKPEDNAGGFYMLVFNSSQILFFIGDTNKDMNWTPFAPQGNNLLIAEQNGARTVSILLIEHERSNFTVVLNYGVIIRTNMEGWMNENEMICWWIMFRQNVQIETVIRDFFWYWILLLHILRHHYNLWMNEAIKDYTPSGKIKRPSYSLVTSWIKLLIRRSFKYCGISNAINGTEDGLIFDFNKVVERINNTGRGIEENVENDDRENEGDNDNSESEPENGYYEENDST
ncbi:pogo transposable element with KRAB domain [Rhizophagus irregularis DAOM 181602=DAOM 197198]|nr:pogo transposable element with KRAB domain [Rhizophagus irregularis DAOM 181602=DAOM 197198]